MTEKHGINATENNINENGLSDDSSGGPSYSLPPATEKAISDLRSYLEEKINGIPSGGGVTVELIDSATSTSTTKAPTAKALKEVNDKATVALDKTDTINKQNADKRYSCPAVATHCSAYVMGSNDASSFTGKLDSTYRSRHVASYDFTDIQLDYGNFHGSSDTPISNDIFVSASIEKKVDGVWTRYPLTFRGVSKVTIGSGGRVTSDKLGFNFAKGEEFYVLTYVSVAQAGHTWGAGIYLTTGVGDGESGVVGNKLTDTVFPWNWQTVGLWEASKSVTVGTWRRASAEWKYLYKCTIAGTTGTATPTSTTDGAIVTDGTVTWQVYQSGATGCYGFTPMSIRGKTKTPVPSIALIGDSIISGAGDNNIRKPSVGGDNCGFVVRAIIDKFGYVALCKAGEATRHFIGTNRMYRILCTEGVTHAVVEHGINDINQNLTFAATRDNLLDIYNDLASRGLKVYATTITPVTTSTDSWATETNQSIKANETARRQLNDWIRTTPSPLSGYFEVADTVETSRNSGIWKAGMVLTTDGLGIHPTPSGHLAMAAAIDTTKFTI